MKWKVVGIITVGIILLGVYGAMFAHGGEAKVSTQVYLFNGEEKVSTVKPGDSVKIAVKVTNDGAVPFGLSDHAPVYAYANIYMYEGSALKKVDNVKFEPKYVVWHVVNINPGKSYTAYIDWNVPDNVSGVLYIEAWAGNAPKSNTTVKVIGSQAYSNYDNEYVSVFTDDNVYYPGNTVEITIVNMGTSPAMFGAGFAVYDGNGNEIYENKGNSMVLLQPGEEVDYSWTVPSNVEPGWYYIYSFANGDYATIYIY